MSSLAALYHVLDNYDRAEKALDEAVKVWRRIKREDDPEFVTTLSNLAMIHYSKGDYNKAERMYDEVLKIQPKITGERNLDYATSMSNLAEIYYAKGDYDKAESLLLKAHGIWRKTKNERDPYFAYSLNTLAAVYRATDRYDDAKRLFLNAKDIWYKIGGEYSLDYALVLNNLSALYRTKGQLHKAKQLLQKAIRIQSKLPRENRLYYAIALSNLGEIYRETGFYDEAKQLLQKAIRIQSKILGESHPNIALDINNLALAYAGTSTRNKALDLMRKVTSITDGTIVQIFSISSDRARMAYLKTIHIFFHSFLSLALTYNYYRDDNNNSVIGKLINEAFDLVLRRKGLAAEALAAQRDAIISNKYPKQKSKLRKLNEVRHDIMRITLDRLNDKESFEKYNQLLTRLNSRKEQLEKELASQIPEVGLDLSLRTSNRQVIANALPRDATLIEFIKVDLFDFHSIFPKSKFAWKPAHYVAFILHGTNPENVQMVDLGKARRIDYLIDEFILSFTTGDKRPSSESSRVKPKRITQNMMDKGKALRKLLFDPLKSAIGESKLLLISPDGDISKLPFEVLPSKQDGLHLIDEYEISYLSTGRDVLRFDIETRGSPSKPLVAADPDFDLGRKRVHKKKDEVTITVEFEEEGQENISSCLHNLSRFHSLAGTKKEGVKIASIVGVKPLLDKEVLESTVKKHRSPLILHIATHGFFLPNKPIDLDRPQSALDLVQMNNRGTIDSVVNASDKQGIDNNPLLCSGLALAGANTWLGHNLLSKDGEDGILTAEDVTGMDLSNTKLATLSACQTALGEIQVGEGVFGLRRAFALAGAQTLVMSLWKVPDEQTKNLMIDFYRQLLNGVPRAEALRKAQLAIKKKYPNPFYWGAFICQGNPSPIVNKN